MNRVELVAAIAEQAKLSKKDADAALKAFVEVVTEQLVKKDKITLVGFGTFETSERAAREGRNPRTGETMKIDGSTAPKFKHGKPVKASADVSVGDVIEILFGTKSVKVEILDIQDTTKKDEAKELFKYL